MKVFGNSRGISWYMIFEGFQRYAGKIFCVELMIFYGFCETRLEVVRAVELVACFQVRSDRSVRKSELFRRLLRLCRWYNELFKGIRDARYEVARGMQKSGKSISFVYKDCDFS